MTPIEIESTKSTPQEKIGLKINSNGVYLIRENGDPIRLPFVQDIKVSDPNTYSNSVIGASFTFLPHFIDITDSNGYQVVTFCEICGALRSECKCRNKSPIIQSLITSIRKDGISPGYITSWNFIYPDTQNLGEDISEAKDRADTSIKYTRHSGDNIPPDATIKGEN